MKKEEKKAFKKMQDEKARGLTDTELNYLKVSGFSKTELDKLKKVKSKNWHFAKQ